MISVCISGLEKYTQYPILQRRQRVRLWSWGQVYKKGQSYEAVASLVSGKMILVHVGSIPDALCVFDQKPPEPLALLIPLLV